MIRVGENVFQFMSVLEIKHKSSSVSVCSVRNIVGVHLGNKRLMVLNLSDENDIKLFKKCILETDYCMQITPEALCSNVQVVFFVVGTTSIQFVLICIFPTSLIQAYNDCLQFIQTTYLSWMFEEGSTE